MRGATQCAKRLKSLVTMLRAKLGKVSPPSSGDPITQLLLGILSRDVPESKAREALDRIRAVVVDYNELRVIPPLELAELLGDYPDVRLKSEDISRALNSVFAKHHAVTLDHLKDLPKKELLAQLEQIDGLEAYSRARIRLLGLQHHAIPLDEAMWAYARREEIVDGRCPLQEAQAFLERRIAPEDALEFVALLKRQAWTEMASAVRRREVERILSIPPDRTTRNMLQAVGAAARATATTAPPETPEPAAAAEGAKPAAAAPARVTGSERAGARRSVKKTPAKAAPKKKATRKKKAASRSGAKKSKSAKSGRKAARRAAKTPAGKAARKKAGRRAGGTAAKSAKKARSAARSARKRRTTAKSA